MSNENEQRFLLREIENLKQRLERLEIQERGRFIDIPTTTTDTGIIVADGTDGKKIKSTSAKIDASGNLELLSTADLKLKSYNIGKWASWTPTTYTGWSALPTGTYYYCVIGNLLIFNIDMTAGTSNGTNAIINLPLTVKNNQVFGGACGLAYDNGVLLTTPARWYVDNVNSYVIFNKTMGTDTWTNSGTKRVRCIGFAEV